jgi:hypothetical protein
MAYIKTVLHDRKTHRLIDDSYQWTDWRPQGDV